MNIEINMGIFYQILCFLITWYLRIEHKFCQYFSSQKSAKSKETADSQEAINENAARLLDSYGNAILRLAYSYLHNLCDAEDVLQETMIKYLQNAPSFHNPAHEKAWLLHVAANVSKNKIEYNRIRETDELSDTLQTEENEDLSYVWTAVKELPEKYREVIHLFYYEGYPTAQIARILERKESSVRSDLHRGRERLKEILKERYDFEQVI